MVKVSYVTSYDENYNASTEFDYDKIQLQIEELKLKDIDLNCVSTMNKIITLADICNYKVNLNYLKKEIDFYLKNLDLIALKNKFDLSHYYQFKDEYIQMTFQYDLNAFCVTKDLNNNTLEFEIIYDDLFVYKNRTGKIYLSDSLDADYCEGHEFDIKLGQVNTSHELIDLLKDHKCDKDIINQLHVEYYTWFNGKEL